MADEDKFCLKWNDFQDNIVRAHSDLRNDKDFYDVSLVCGGETFKAHRVILAACSPAFRDMIRESPHHHPVLYLRGVRKGDVAALLDFMYHGEASLPEDDLEDFLATAEDLQVRGLVMGEEQASGERSRRVSGSNMATALDDDVASLLAGLDGDGPAQPPPAKKVKQERHEAGKQLASLSHLSVSSATSSMSRDELAARIRVKQEAREQQQDDTSSVEAAKRKLANLTNSISLGKNSEAPAPSQAPPQYQAQAPQPPQASMDQISARNQEILKQLMVSSTASSHTSAPQPVTLQAAPQAYNITSLTQGAILRHIQQSSNTNSIQQQVHAQQQVQAQQQAQAQQVQQAQQLQQQQVLQLQQQQQAQLRQQQQQQRGPGQPSPQLQQLVRVHAPPAPPHHQAMSRVQMQAAGPASPPVLHIPEGFHQGLNSQAGGGYSNPTTSATPSPATNENTSSNTSLTTEGPADDDSDHQRQIEAYIEKVQTSEGPKLQCRACQKVVHSKSKATMVNHIESTHIQTNVSCNYCSKTFKARSYLKNHLKKCGPTAS